MWRRVRHPVGRPPLPPGDGAGGRTVKGVYRFLLTPRWWALNVLAALAIVVCLVMGGWQLGRFEARVDTHREQQRAQERAGTPRADEVAPLAELLPVDRETSGEAATATGRYARQLLVPDRRLDGRTGFYVLTLLRTEGGKALPVVRGWLPGAADPAKAPDPPAGEVTVTGAVQASEHRGSPGVRMGGGLPEGQLGMISAAALINVVDYPVYDAWITLPGRAGGGAGGGLRPVPAELPEGSGLDLKAFQNLGYTAQWFVFAGFVLFMWYRFFRREAEAVRDAELGITPGPRALQEQGPQEQGRQEGAPEPSPEPDDAARSRAPASPA